jgi:hypothetical protein
MDHRSFRDMLTFSIGFAVARERSLLRRILTEHAPDDARALPAQRVLEHLELSGFESDETAQVMRKRPSGGSGRRAALPVRRRAALERLEFISLALSPTIAIVPAPVQNH